MMEESTIQDLLNKDAQLGNDGLPAVHPFRQIVQIEIKQRRGGGAPACWGEDDCSISMLMRCPWRIDCGS